MESEREEERDERESERDARAEQPPELKLRDLRPEKDPMGAANHNRTTPPL